MYFFRCKVCGFVPMHGTLNGHGLCCGRHDKRKCRMCRRYLGPHLDSDGDGSLCNACAKKSTQRGGATAYKALRDSIEEHVIDGGDDQSLEFLINSNDETSRRILQDAIDIHKYVQNYLYIELVFIYIELVFIIFLNRGGILLTSTILRIIALA